MKSKKRTIAALTAVASVLLVLFLLLTFWWYGYSYPYFDSVSRREKHLPGLSTGLSPQGVCALPAGGVYQYAMSGYISGEPSRVYLLFADPAVSDVKKTECFVTFTESGKAIKTHFGGVTCSESTLYIASGKKIVYVSLEKLYAAPSGAAVEIDGSFSTGIQNAYCYLYGDTLYAGEFYRPGNYETDVSHHIETSAGTNHALVYAFPLDQIEAGVSDMVPTKALSVCDEVQGIAIDGEHIVLSCSYGLPDSRLHIYPNVLDEVAQQTISVGGAEVPLYVLEDMGANMILPCMSEEIFLKDGRLYILFESMSLKYRFVVHTRISALISVEVESLLDIDVREKLTLGLPFSLPF